MEISEVKVKLMGDRSDRLKAFCSVTVDKEFVIRDLKIIEGTNGTFVAMPSRKITDKCPTCSGKNHLRAKFCNECGGRLNENRAGRDLDGRTKLHADIAHPINSGCRDRMQKKIVKSYEEELQKSKLPGYKPTYDEDFDETEFVDSGTGVERERRREERARDATPTTEPGGKPADADDSFAQGIL